MEDPLILKIKSHFDTEGNPARIPVLNGKKTFTARLEEDGITVDNLGNQPFLPWEVFSQAVNCLKENYGQVKKGNAANSRLGDSNLELNTLEGYIASKVYGCKTGDIVFKRIVPIASILAWAEICKNSRGQICLLPQEAEFEAKEKNDLTADLQVLAEKFIAADCEIRKLEDKLLAKEKRINNLEVALTTSEDKVKKLEKQLADRKGEESLAVQLEEKEELIKQLKGTLASKEEEFSRLNEENRRYKRQQKFESEGLKQIEEQKSARKWWKNW